jgi:hypothetical protein
LSTRLLTAGRGVPPSWFDSLDTLNHLVSDPQLKDAMYQAGVLGAPRIEIYEEVEAI